MSGKFGNADDIFSKKKWKEKNSSNAELKSRAWRTTKHRRQKSSPQISIAQGILKTLNKTETCLFLVLSKNILDLAFMKIESTYLSSQEKCNVLLLLTHLGVF